MFPNQKNSASSFNPHVLRILWRQQQELLKKAPDGVCPYINNEDPLDIQADIQGPKGTPYENGVFRVKFYIPTEFPRMAPKGYFITKIYHPNVSEKGEICVNTLKKDWDSKKWSLYNLFEVIKCLLIVPFPESSLNEEAGKIFMEDYNEYCTISKIYTKVHAMKHNGSNSNSDDMMMIDDEPQMKPAILKSRTLHYEVKRNKIVTIDNNNRDDSELGIIEEMPSMTKLPFLRINSLQVNTKSVFCVNAFQNVEPTDIIQQKRNNKEEIQKWLMRI